MTSPSLQQLVTQGGQPDREISLHGAPVGSQLRDQSQTEKRSFIALLTQARQLTQRRHIKMELQKPLPLTKPYFSQGIAFNTTLCQLGFLKEIDRIRLARLITLKRQERMIEYQRQSKLDHASMMPRILLRGLGRLKMNEADWQGLLNWTANGQSVKLERTQRETEWAQGSIPPTKTEARASFTADSTTAILIILSLK